MAVAKLEVANKEIDAFCERYHIKELSLFGSILRDDFGADSDIDVLVQYAPDAHPTLREALMAQEEISALFGRPVDLVDKVSVERSPNYIRRKHILDSALRVYVAR